MIPKDINSLAVGDIVARPVYDDKSNVLVHEGAEITEALMRVLKRRGVEEVIIKEEVEVVEDIKHQDEVSLTENDPVVKQKVEEMHERLNVAFQRHEGNVTMAVLYKTVLDYLTMKIAKGER